MSELYKEVPSILIPTKMGMRALHEHNTGIFLHEDPYQGFDHIFEQLGNDRGIFLFRELVKDFDELVACLLGISVNVRNGITEPSDTDRRAWNETFNVDKVIEELHIPDIYPDFS